MMAESIEAKLHLPRDGAGHSCQRNNDHLCPSNNMVMPVVAARSNLSIWEAETGGLRQPGPQRKALPLVIAAR